MHAPDLAVHGRVVVQLLSPVERDVFDRLSVFAGGFDLDRGRGVGA